MAEKLAKDEKILSYIVKGVIGLCLLLFILFLWVFNPGVNADKFSNETVWEAVHPYHWLKDSIGMLGVIAFGLYVAGVLGKTVYSFTGPKAENSPGLVHVIAVIGVLCVILLFV